MREFSDLLSDLHRYCNELHSLPSAEDIPKRAVVMVADLARVPYAEVWFLDREAEVIRLAAVNDEAYLSDDLLRVLPLDENVVGEIIATAAVKIHPDLREVPYWRRGKWSEEKGLTQYIGVPLFFEDRVVGAFSILAESHHHLGLAEIQILQLFADQTATATLRKQMEDELVRAGKLASLGVLSGGVSHEILNPLNIIKLKLHMLLEDKAQGPEQRQEAREMMDAVDRISEVIRGLAVFTSHMKAERQPVAIQEELARATQRIEDEARQRGVEVVEDYLPASPMVMGNLALLHQLFEHILRNAVDAMPDGGTLAIQVGEALREGAPQVDIGITDTGVGIPQEHFPKVFDPFFTTRDVGEGKGLGLSIAHGIVEHLGGTISVESAEGRGTTFIIQLPVKPD